MISIVITYFDGNESVYGGTTLEHALEQVKKWHKDYPDKAPSIEDIKSIKCNK